MIVFNLPIRCPSCEKSILVLICPSYGRAADYVVKCYECSWAAK